MNTFPAVILTGLLLSSSTLHSLDKSHCGDCGLSLKDTTFADGCFIKYLVKNDDVQIEWGNQHFTRILNKHYDCNGAPVWVPWANWISKNFIGLKYGCGSPCWGFLALPLNPQDSVIEGMYDIGVDTSKNQVAYLGGDDDDLLVIEDLQTRKKQMVQPKVDCRAAFIGFCIDSVRLSNNKLFIKWAEQADGPDSIRNATQLVDVKL